MNAARESRKAAREILRLKAGDSLDHLVAMEVMGWVVGTCEPGYDNFDYYCCVVYRDPVTRDQMSAFKFSGRRALSQSGLWFPSTRFLDAARVFAKVWPDQSRPVPVSVSIEDESRWCLDVCLTALAEVRRRRENA